MDIQKMGDLLEITAEFHRLSAFNDLVNATPHHQAIELDQESRKIILEHLCRHILDSASVHDKVGEALTTLSMRHFMAKFGPTTSTAISGTIIEKLEAAKKDNAAAAILDNVHIPYGIRKSVRRSNGILQL